MVVRGGDERNADSLAAQIVRCGDACAVADDQCFGVGDVGEDPEQRDVQALRDRCRGRGRADLADLDVACRHGADHVRTIAEHPPADAVAGGTFHFLRSHGGAERHNHGLVCNGHFAGLSDRWRSERCCRSCPACQNRAARQRGDAHSSSLPVRFPTVRGGELNARLARGSKNRAIRAVPHRSAPGRVDRHAWSQRRRRAQDSSGFGGCALLARRRVPQANPSRVAMLCLVAMLCFSCSPILASPPSAIPQASALMRKEGERNAPHPRRDGRLRVQPWPRIRPAKMRLNKMQLNRMVVRAGGGWWSQGESNP